MASWSKLGEFGFKDIEAALEVEDNSLGSLFQSASKQLNRLELEEKMLHLMLNKLQQENNDALNDAKEDGRYEEQPSPLVINTRRRKPNGTTPAVGAPGGNKDRRDDTQSNKKRKTANNRISYANKNKPEKIQNESVLPPVQKKMQVKKQKKKGSTPKPYKN